MTKFSIKNVIELCSFDLRIHKNQIIGWTLAIAAVMAMYMFFFPSVQDMATMKMEAMPKELLQLFGMGNMQDMSNYTSYFGMIYILVLLAISIFAATFSASLITSEEKSKSAEFLLAQSVSRTEIYVAKYLCSFVGILSITMVAMLVTIACGIYNGGPTFNQADIILGGKTSSFTPFLFGAIALCLAGLSRKFAGGAIVSLVVMASYMLGYLGEILGEDAEALLMFSPFASIGVEKVIAAGDAFYIAINVYYAIYIVALVLGGWLYNRRDLEV